MLNNKTGRPALAGLVWVALLAICYGCYSPGIPGPFLLDDMPNLKSSAIDVATIDNLLQATFSNSSGPSGRPVSALTFALSSLSGGDNKTYKRQNVLLHLLVGTLAFWFILRLLLDTQHPRIGSAQAPWIAIAVAAIWLFHPLHVSTTLYVVQRMTQLAALFSLAALLFYLAARRQFVAAHYARFTAYVCAGVLMIVLGVYSKENAVLVPLLVMATELAFSNHTSLTDARVRFCRFALLAGGSIATVAVFVYAVGGNAAILDGYGNRNFDLENRLLTQINVIWIYISFVLRPTLQAMGLFHDDIPIQDIWTLKTALLLAALLGVVAAAICLRKAVPLIAMGISFFFAGHLLESTILPLEIAFEHRNYLPSLGLITVAVLLGRHSMSLGRFRPGIQTGMAVTIIALLGFMLTTRSQVWASQWQLMKQMQADHPRSARVHTYLANLHAERGDYRAARGALETAETLRDNNPGTVGHLLFFQCILAPEVEVSDELISNAADKYANGLCTPYGMTTMRSVLRSVRRGQCPAIMPQELVKLARAQATNPRCKGEMHFHAQMSLARALWIDDQLDAALDIYESLFDQLHLVTPPERKTPIIDAFYVYLAAGKFDEAVSSLDRLKELAKSPLTQADEAARRLDLQLQAVPKQRQKSLSSH